ncbi:universal stress protein [Streptomyces sp. NPDC048484]|uniref:universal stress protein n=1 Tax=Streptomyces sp. NPDC048484 TaxID=3155146 RepID=UPI0034329D75
MTQPTDDNGIVVGVDGSEAAVSALRWAAEQARCLHTQVVAVHAWEPTADLFAPYAPASARPTIAEQREQAAGVLASAVREVFGPRTGDSVRALLLEGRPERVLLQQARGARLLALGRRAHGQEYEPPTLGSVDRTCLRHAPVPVVTVPVPDRLAPPLRAVVTPTTGLQGPADGPNGTSSESLCDAAPSLTKRVAHVTIGTSRTGQCEPCSNVCATWPR